jgi:hypothetical protein
MALLTRPHKGKRKRTGNFQLYDAKDMLTP